MIISRGFVTKLSQQMRHNVIFRSTTVQRFVGREKFVKIQIWCDFDCASSLICGNKMPTRCNKYFYCRYYCLLNMFRAPVCPSSGAQEYYTVVAACGISCCGFHVAGLVWSWGLCVRFAGCCSILQTGHITLQQDAERGGRGVSWNTMTQLWEGRVEVT